MRRHGTASLSKCECGLQLCPSRQLYKDSKVISLAAIGASEVSV